MAKKEGFPEEKSEIITNKAKKKGISIHADLEVIISLKSCPEICVEWALCVASQKN